MKQYLFLPAAFTLLFALSCTREKEPAPEPVQPEGVIQKLLQDSSAVFVLDRKDYNTDYVYPTTSIDAGYFFQPEKDITLLSIGVKAQEAADYQVIIRRLDPTFRIVSDTLLRDTVQVRNDADFFYKKLSKPIQLKKDFEYAIYYYNKSIRSIWNVVYTKPYHPNQPLIFPMKRGDLVIKENFSIYYSNGLLYRQVIGRGNGLRGLVDFKYQ